MIFSKVRRYSVSHHAPVFRRGGSLSALHRPGSHSLATMGGPESRAAQVAGRRTLFEFACGGER